MTTIATNTDLMRAILNKDFNKEEALECLDTIEKEMMEQLERNDELSTELDEQKQINEDAVMIDEFEEIDGGIGKIWYKTDNLKLGMELDDFFDSKGYRKR